MNSSYKIIFLSELIGTTIISMGCSLVKIYLYDNTQIGSVLTVLGVVFISIILFADFSGSHFNTAVTIMFYLIEDDPKKKTLLYSLFPYYITAQLLGAFSGGLISAFLYDGNIQIMELAEGLTHFEGFLFEFLGSFLFYCLILVNTYNDKYGIEKDKALNALITVMGLGLGISVSGHYSVAGVNPSVSTGLIFSRVIITEKYRLISLTWFYVTAPIMAASLASFIYVHFYKFYFELLEVEKKGGKGNKRDENMVYMKSLSCAKI
jgi:glycerol uptake facilitator-like aquaporin